MQMKRNVIVGCRLPGDLDDYSLLVYLDRQSYFELGPFDAEEERARFYEELMALLKRSGRLINATYRLAIILNRKAPRPVQERTCSWLRRRRTSELSRLAPCLICEAPSN